MNKGTTKTGAEAEQVAADYLLCQGLKLVTRNFRCRGGVWR